MTATPKPGRLLRRPNYHFDITGTWAAGPPFDASEVPVPAKPLQLPAGGLTEPFLWHAGSARALGGFDAVPTEDAAFQHGGFTPAYYPAPSRWGKAGTLLRRPRAVWLNWNTGGFDAATVYGACSTALARKDASLILGIPPVSACAVSDWAPQPLGLVTHYPDPPTYPPVVDPGVWMAGELLVLQVSGSPYVSNMVVEFSTSTNPGWDEFPIDGTYSVFIDRPGIAAGRGVYPSLVARCGRFRGVLLYDPSPPDSDPPNPTWADIEGAYSPDTLWDDVTGGLGWTRTAVAGLGAVPTPDSGALGAAVAAQVLDFFT